MTHRDTDSLTPTKYVPRANVCGSIIFIQGLRFIKSLPGILQSSSRRGCLRRGVLGEIAVTFYEEVSSDLKP